MLGLLNPKSSETGQIFCTILVVYLGHGMLHPVPVLIFFRVSFCLREVLSSQIEQYLRKKVVHLFHSTRLSADVGYDVLTHVNVWPGHCFRLSSCLQHVKFRSGLLRIYRGL